MRIPKSWVPLLARQIVNNLVNKGLIEPPVSVEQLIEETGTCCLMSLWLKTG